MNKWAINPWQTMALLLKFLGYSANHFKWLFGWKVSVLVFLAGVNQGKITGFQRDLFLCLVHKCTTSFDYIDHLKHKLTAWYLYCKIVNLYQLGTHTIDMVIVSSREFRDHQKKYFDMVDQNEQIIVQRGKDKSYVIVPLNDADRLSVNDQLIQSVQEAETEYAKQKTTRIKDPGDIWESIL